MPYKFNPFSGNFDEVKDISGKVDKVTSTDNAVTRYDGTTGDVQNSGVTIDDSNNVIIPGNLTVNGTTTTINTTNLEVTDANITINNGGNQASADGIAGLRVEMSDTLDASLIYDSTTQSRFKIGDVGFEGEILTSTATQSVIAEKLFTTLTLSSGTASTVPYLNASKQFVSSTVTPTELGYLSSVTSSIQTQLNSKAVIADVFSMNTTSGVDTLTANETYIVNTSGGASTITLPAVATDIFIRIKDNGNAETNNITITPASGTIDGAASHIINSNYGSVVIACDGVNWFVM